MEYQINPKYAYLEKEILSVPIRFDKEGELIYKGRNILKVLNIGGIRMCIKSFKYPHIINKVVYAYFRKSKAERSYLYANRFVELGIGTPEPVAYILFRDKVGLTYSYYISLQLDDVSTLRGLFLLPKEEQIEAFRAFTRFTYDFQQKGVYFIDHSLGNTLVKKDDDGVYLFWLVDLNRTQFEVVSSWKGLKNLSMLELPEFLLRTIGEEYALLNHEDKEEMVKRLILLTKAHNEHVKRKGFIRNTRRMIKRRLFS